MELKESVLGKLNVLFFREDDVLRYEGRLCIPNVDDLRNQIREKAHGSHFSIHPRSTKMYHNHMEVFLREGLEKDKRNLLLSVQIIIK